MQVHLRQFLSPEIRLSLMPLSWIFIDHAEQRLASRNNMSPNADILFLSSNADIGIDVVER